MEYCYIYIYTGKTAKQGIINWDTATSTDFTLGFFSLFVYISKYLHPIPHRAMLDYDGDVCVLGSTIWYSTLIGVGWGGLI